jgi:dihydrolipoamide dehydrogenase
VNPKSLIVIGGGPGGMAAALEAVRQQIQVTLIEKQEIGGTCLNRGCIPSKFFLSKAKRYAETAALPTKTDRISFAPSMVVLQQRKNSILTTLRQRMEQSFRGPLAKRIIGRAQLTSPNSVDVELADGKKETLTADVLLLATGTIPFKPAIFPNHPAIFDSTSLLELDHIPSHLVVIGAGYIGCELACAFQGLGSKVTLIEKENRLLPTQDEMALAAPVLQVSMEKRGMTVWLETQVEAVQSLDDCRVKLRCSNGQTIETDATLLAMGRRPDSAELFLDRAGVSLQNGRLQVNERMQTAVPTLYAVGDLVSPLPLAHVAAREAEVAVASMCGEPRAIDYTQIPRCVYTWPEVAAVGLTEAQAGAAGFTPRVDRYHFAASAKAMIEEEAEGFWLLISDRPTRKILGGQIVGPHATELIHLLSLSLKAGFRIDDVLESVLAHPSLSEGFQEVARRASITK